MSIYIVRRLDQEPTGCPVELRGVYSDVPRLCEWYYLGPSCGYDAYGAWQIKCLLYLICLHIIRLRNLILDDSATHFRFLYSRGGLRITMTESPLRNSLLMKRSRFITLLPFFSVHSSFTFSNTILQCLSNAFTLAIILWLFLSDIITGVLDSIASLIRDIGPCLNSNSSSCSSSSLFSSDFGRSRICSLRELIQWQ